MAVKKPAKTPLSAREIKFCRHYAEYENATKAYLESGYKPASTNAAGVAAFHLLRKTKIREYIRDLQDAACEAAMVSIEDLARGFRRAERADIRKIMGPDGEMLPPDKWPDEVAKCITRVEIEELTEMQPDPARPGKKKKVAIGTKWKVWLENKTECRKVLAQWKRMIGSDAEAGKGAPAPLVVSGEANPDAL